MPRHFLDHEFLGKRALYCTSIVQWPANSTQTSEIYKFTIALPHHTLFFDTKFVHESSDTCNLTFRSSHLLGNYCHRVLKPLPSLSIFLHFLESLSRVQFHTYPNFFACGFPDRWTALQMFLDLETAPPLPRYTN
jgi:hypothetical protein